MISPMCVPVNGEVKMPIKFNCLHSLRKIPNRFKILTLVLSFYVALIYLHGKVRQKSNGPIKKYENSEVQMMSDAKNHDRIVKKYFDQRENWPTSNLGSILFKNANISEYTTPGPKQKFKILIWKRYEFLSSRHIVGFNGLRKDPFDDCSVNNCNIVGGDEHLGTADAVVVHLHTGVLPNQKTRKPRQRWIFLSDESPKFTFALSNKKVRWADLADIFNWSMTFRSDSDVPVPYGRTISLEHPKITNVEDLKGIIPYWNNKRTERVAAILMSNCASARKLLLKKIEKYLPFEGFGQCFEKNKNACPGRFRKDCPQLNDFLFYFSFENSHCDQYLTEKIFYNAYDKGAIPVIFGPSIRNCEMFLPPHSYLHVNEFPGVVELVKKIRSLAKDTNKLLEYHMWRIHFEVINEHGYFDSKSQHYCRICEALNYNNKEPKIYGKEQLRNFLSPDALCESSVKIYD